MRYDYWVIRYVPDPIRGEFVNIGVIAGKGDDWSFRRVSNLRRASRLGGFASLTDSFLRRIEDSIASRLDAVEALIPSEPSELFGRGEVEDLRVRMNNLVQLSESRPVLAATSEEAADLAFELMVVDSDVDVRHRSRTTVVHKLRAAFDLRPELVHHVARFHVASVGAQETGIDFAVKDGVVHQMSQVWAFDVKNTRHLQTQIQAWNYLLGLLRQDGGALVRRGRHDGVSIPHDVDINAVFTAPTTSDGEAQFEIAKDGWQRLGVEVVSSSDSEAIVDAAARLLTASSPS
ncbi:DUF3037 domain-containing protein [Kribbella sp. VKM Ac-2568]|uniref:DUF3037 domain-containing protein n=1 Tax=Kribbella sp. VKM Ac-2568 TaxID=2512219 RepID=UPI00104C94AD|nr:DUF3037 domain-containing protein [Kribbella sp. VKM Ac-2568]TCM45557.1 DUF3037 family protein [Kribbella sp. VKM Ac-2568]